MRAPLRSDVPPGCEVWEIHPVILGGDPVDPANKVVVDRAKHIELVRWWNRVIAQQRAQARVEQ